MGTGRVVVMVVVAALIAGPVAYAQIESVWQGADLMLAAFGPGDP